MRLRAKPLCYGITWDYRAVPLTAVRPHRDFIAIYVPRGAELPSAFSLADWSIEPESEFYRPVRRKRSGASASQRTRVSMKRRLC